MTRDTCGMAVIVLLLHQQLAHIHVVILLKDEGAGLGFSIAGGSDHESKAPTVSSNTISLLPFFC